MNFRNLLLLGILTTTAGAKASSMTEPIVEMRPQELHCIILSNQKVSLHTVDVDDYAMAVIQYRSGDWTFYADVIESKINSIKIEHSPSQVRSIQYSTQLLQPQSLTTQLTVGNAQSSIDCEIRVKK